MTNTKDVKRSAALMVRADDELRGAIGQLMAAWETLPDGVARRRLNTLIYNLRQSRAEIERLESLTT